MADKVGSSINEKSSSVTEEISHQDHNQRTNKKPLSFLLPLPRLLPSSPSPVSHPSDQAFLQAADIFQRLREEKPVTLQLLHYGKKTDAPLPESGDKTTQRQAYQLAFNTLKYQDLLEDIIIDSCFHTSQHISTDLLPLAMVMLFDLQDRRFMMREPSMKNKGEPPQKVRDLERSLHRCKTKLAASLARCRVKQNLQSVSCFLSDPVKTKQRRAKRLPLYAWVNTLRTSVEEVCEVLQSADLHQVKSMTDLKDSTFCRDTLCLDTLIFPQQLHALVQHCSLTATHVLNIQDRSVCVAVSVLRPLLFDSSDVLVVGSFSGMTVAHIAVAAAARSGRVLVCGADHTTAQVEEVQDLLKQMEIKNVRILSEAFYSLNEWDASIQRLKVIIVLPQCSSSALNDPVLTIHSEHGDWSLLPELSHGSVSLRKIHIMAAQQARLLAHSLTFPGVQTVVYCTRSVYPEENEQLVKRVLEKTQTHPKLLPFRVNGPIFPDESQSGDAADAKFFRLEPSEFTNGCFIARLSRQADPTKIETAQDVLARAAAKGLLGGIIPEHSKTGKRGKSKKNRGALSPSNQETQTEGKLGNGQDPAAPSEDEDERGEGDFKGSEEGEKVGDEVGKEEKKSRGHKGRKRKLRPKQSTKAPAGSKHQPKTPKRKPTTRKINQPHPKKRLTKRKRRRFPRLTLTLMSSEKPSNHLSSITALAHKLKDNPVVKSQESVLLGSASSPAGKHPSPACPAPRAPSAASKQLQRHNTQPKMAEKTLKDADEPVKLSKAGNMMVRPEKGLKASDSGLPPISSPSSSSVRSRTCSSLSHTNMSAASSQVSLPGL